MSVHEAVFLQTSNAMWSAIVDLTVSLMSISGLIVVVFPCVVKALSDDNHCSGSFAL